MKSKRRRRYKKKKYDLFLISKIALICYLAIFGVGYMTSDTSAYFSSQSEISQTITAGFWEVPQVLVNGCGEESPIDEVSSEGTEYNIEDETSIEIGNDVLPGEEINIDSEDKDINPIEESEKDGIPSGENEIDCGNKEDVSKAIVEEDTAGEIDCKNEDDSLVGENEKDATLSKEFKADCKDKDDEPKEEIQKEKVPEDLKTIEPIIKQQNEIENAENEAEKQNEEKVNVDDPQKSDDESQKETDLKDESVKESKDEKPTEKDSTKDETSLNDEITDAVK